jgi:hypothetical protein
MRRAVLVLILMYLSGSAARAQITTGALLDTIQHASFEFFWNEANPANGLIKDRSAGGAPCSIASTGFGLSAICIGVDHGWVSRQAARDRVLTTLRTFWLGPQGDGPSGFIGYQGFFYHFLDMATATRTWTSELSTIDTGLLLAGIIDAKQYFTSADSTETQIRALADSIYRRMDWEWFRNYHYGILMQWTPEHGFSTAEWVGYCEASIMYILAMGSPTHPIDYTGWQKWTQGYNWATGYGYSFVIFPPLFGHQYSHCWIDYRNIADDYMREHGSTYFENSRRATLAQRAYCTINPHKYTGYSDSLWGITASDVQNGYAARGAPPDQGDDGTITPTAPVSSIAFAPDSVLPTIRNMWNNYRGQLWTPYGFRDAFNLQVNWWDSDIIGIDQGPMVIMIENYRTGSVWDRFMRNADVQRGLHAAHFQPVTSVEQQKAAPAVLALFQNYPNPFNPATKIAFRIAVFGTVRLSVYDVLGREVAMLLNGFLPPGEHEADFDGSGLASGLYVYRLTSGTITQARTMMLLR